MNIYDVAKMAGVSIATVSRVVNGSPKVSEKTKKKVLSIIEQEDYTPNVFARGLGLDSMKTVGILCPDIADDCISRIVAVLEKQLSKYGYHCIVSSSGVECRDKEKYARLLMSKRIDAMILIGSVYMPDADDGHEADYIYEAAAKIPVFLLDAYLEGKNIYSFVCGNYEAVYDVTSAFIRRGRKRILFLGDFDIASTKEKLRGYEMALSDVGYPVLGELKLNVKKDIHYVKNLLLGYKDLSFDAVVAAEDVMAVGAVKYAKARGLYIPEDVSICGCGNSVFAVSCEPEITSVNYHLKKMCVDAVDLLIRVFSGEEDLPQEVKVPYTVERRCTTDF